MYQQDYLVYHNMLMQPDTMRFAFWSNDDTLFVKKIIKQYVPTVEESVNTMSFQSEKDQNTVEGSRLFNGMKIRYTYDNEKFLLSGDTLYKFVITNKLSSDSINALFGRGKDADPFNKSQYLRNLQIIAQNRMEEKKVMYHPGFFTRENTKVIQTKKNCPDTLKVNRKWQSGNKTYQKISLSYNCGSYHTTTSVIIDQNNKFYGFDGKYISLEMSPFLQTKPFKSRYFLKPKL
jgi:hypothetical protein